jgi:integrase
MQMPKTKRNQGSKHSPKQPTIYRQKRRNGQDTAFTRIDGRRVHLGVYGSPEAEKEYRRVVAEYNTGFIVPKQTGTNVSVAELVLRFLKERKTKVSPLQWDFERRPAAVLVGLYGDTEAVAFDINCLRTVRNEFIKKRYVRQKVNWRIQIIQRIFRWGSSYKIVPASVWHELKSLAPITKGEYGLRESKERQTVSLADVEKTLAELCPVKRAMVVVHLANAARPTEICEVRIENIDRIREDFWAIKLNHHKTDYLENAEPKILYLAKPEIDVLLPLIGDRTEGYIFRPIDSIRYEKQRRANEAVQRKKQPSRAARDTKRAENPKQKFAECYDFNAYRKAVYRACDRAGVARWFPYQLRHTGITLIGLEHGISAAQYTAGHKDSRMTEKYFHGGNEIARRVAELRNTSASVEATVEEIEPASDAAREQSKTKDDVIAELLNQNKQLLEMLAKKSR